MFKKLKLWYLSKRCPNFYEDMPKENKVGKWEVGSMVYTIRSCRETDIEVFEGSRVDAYILARKIALKRDDVTPYADGELGVRWFVRELVVDKQN